ncbi:unnamed protein product [Blepharisma stoltei]|uniref:Uncharacterized protein n=1 Tax=Blepharisma stoltei TaxID=1481888 RepID=A0AAU9JAW0_9CILI|nr:unnamed protein product [Blepharisma stoltei]
MKASPTQTPSRELFWIPLIFFSSSISLIFVSLTQKSWVILENEEFSFNMSLARCTNCPSFYENWTWKCFTKFVCDSIDNSTNCMIYSYGFKASSLLYFLDLISYVLGLIVIEKLILALNWRYYGNKAVLSLSAVFMVLTHVSGILIWFFIEWSDFETFKNNFDLYFQQGPIIGLINISFCFLSLASLWIIMWKVGKIKHIQNSISLTACIKSKTFHSWMIVVGVLLGISFFTVLYATFYDTWIIRFHENISWNGGLFYCNHCEELFPHLEWECLSLEYCSIDPSSRTCKIFTDISDANEIYFLFETLALVSFIFFMQAYINILRGKNYGFPIMSYIYVVCIPIFNLLALISWVLISNVDITFSCKSDAKNIEKSDACSYYGPLIHISSNLFLIPMAAIFCYAFYKRESISNRVKMEEITENTERNAPKSQISSKNES